MLIMCLSESSVSSSTAHVGLLWVGELLGPAVLLGAADWREGCFLGKA
jgi:hypothetical protein